ncbi:MAG TPA: hypothetical protein VN289_12425, partial [Paraburkholderia sp.]|nr:hypothetical protein [Paraburkholderia sp.]
MTITSRKPRRLRTLRPQTALRLSVGAVLAALSAASWAQTDSAADATEQVAPAAQTEQTPGSAGENGSEQTATSSDQQVELPNIVVVGTT